MTQNLAKNLLATFGVAGAFTASGLYYYTPKQNSYVGGEIEPATLKKIEEAYERLNKGAGSEKCKSLLKKYFTRDVLDKCKNRKSQLGASLYDVIRSGVFNLDAGVGVYAPDQDSYKVFAPLFDPIIQDYHGFGPNDRQPPVDLGEGKTQNFPPLDPKGKYIKSTRIRCGRTLKGYPFNPTLSEDDYLIMEQKIKNAFAAFKDEELKGTYYPLLGMTKETQKQLIADHFLFKEGDRHLQAANACRYWPKGRGIYHNNDKTFLIWVNEEDHMRIISMENGSDVGRVLERLNRGIKSIEKKVPFARDERLGWLTFCPTNLGSTVRASVHIVLPKLSARKDFVEICERLNLQVRGIHGEHSESVGGVYDISNKARLGLSEYEAVKQMYDGVKELIRLEEAEKQLGCENAVKVIRESELLHRSNVAHEWGAVVEEVVTGRHLSALPGVIQMSRQLAHHTCDTVRRGKELLVLGGDHSCAIGTWSGVATALRPIGDVGLLWIDAHMDAHRPETSDTGNIHGMPVAHLLGFGDRNLCRVGDRLPKIRPENLAMVGIRSYEPKEQELLEGLGVRIFYMDEVERRGIRDVLQEAFHIVNRGTVGFGLSIDIDGFRVSDAPAVGTPEEGGIVARHFLHALLELNLRRMVAAEIVEFLPRFDDRDRTSERLVVNLVETLFLTKFFQLSTTEQIAERMGEVLEAKTSAIAS